VEARQLLRQAGLADTGVARDQHRARLLPVDDLEQPAHQQAELGVAADHRRLVPEAEPARRGRAQRDELVGADRLALALEPQRRQRPPGGPGHRRDRRVAAGVDRADAGRVGQPRRRVHRVADDRVRQVRLHAGQHLAGVQADPQAEPPAATALLLHHPAHRRLHPRRGAHGPLGVVLVRGRGAEDRHQPVAGELVDVAAELGDGGGERREHPVGDDAHPLRVEVLRPAREVRQVAEQHGDDPPLGARLGAHGRRQLQPAGEAEARPGHGRRGAPRAGHGAPRRWASCASTDSRAAGQTARSTSA
jgi:hypothetical protein